MHHSLFSASDTKLECSPVDSERNFIRLLTEDRPRITAPLFDVLFDITTPSEKSILVESTLEDGTHLTQLHCHNSANVAVAPVQRTKDGRSLARTFAARYPHLRKHVIKHTIPPIEGSAIQSKRSHTPITTTIIHFLGIQRSIGRRSSKQSGSPRIHKYDRLRSQRGTCLCADGPLARVLPLARALLGRTLDIWP